MGKVINGIEFDISLPYAEGHTCTAAEAKALNQTRAENVGNNTRAKIKEMQEAGESEDAIKTYVLEIDSGYQFTLAAVRASRKLDPVEREARAIARDLLKDHLAQTGRKLNVAPSGKTKEEWDEIVENEIDRIATSDEILKAAKKAVDDKKNRAAKLMGVVSGEAAGI